MSTLKTTNIQHPSASTPAITLDSAGAMTGSFPSSNRNLLYNGAHQITQRSTSIANITTSGYYTSDRWTSWMSSMGTWTNSIENDAPTGSGFRKSFKLLCTTADASPASGDYVIVAQLLEGQDLQRIAKGTSSAQQLTLSFWVKSNTLGTYIVGIEDADNSRYIAASYIINSANTWEKKNITFSSDIVGQFNNDNQTSLILQFWLGTSAAYGSGTLQTSWGTMVNADRSVGQINLAASVNNYWQMTGAQLETGTVATPFEFKSYGQELRECQRYYYRYINTGVNTAYVGNGIGYTATRVPIYFSLPVSMRADPVVGYGGTVSISDFTNTLTLNSMARYNGGNRDITIDTTVASGGVQYRPYFIGVTQNSYIDFNSEL